MALRFLKLCLSLAAASLLGAAARAPSAPSLTPWMRDTAHFSNLRTIDASNVARLGVAWEFDGYVRRGVTHRGVESTPSVKDGVMYTTGPWSVVYALDARTGKSLWTYDPEVDGQYARRTCCDAVNRGVALDDGRIYVATLDGYLIALDAKSGKPLWKSDTFTDRSRSYASTGAPRIAGDVVVIGNGGAEMGTRGYVTAYDKRTGKFAWRFYIVPGDPAAGPDEHPEVSEARKTWDPNSAWNLGGGGNAWDSMVYDPNTDTLYVGTGNGSPHPAWLRSPAGGDNLYISTILALDPKTGRKKWHYQTTPRDSWDFTATQNLILADLIVKGRIRKVVIQAPKNGFLYVLDRVTGELLSAEKYTTVTWADRVDLKTGKPVFTDQGNYSKARKLIWPSEAGGHNWQPMAFNADTGLVYIPVHEMASTFETTPMPYAPYSVVQGDSADVPALAPAGTVDPAILKGQPTPKFNDILRAYEPTTGKVVWSSQVLPFWSGGVLTTASGLVLQGSADGQLRVYAAKTGNLLRQINIGTGIMAAPMAYELDGEAYIAIAAGFGGSFNDYFPPGTAGEKYDNKARLLVFKLGGSSPVLPALRKDQLLLAAPAKYRGVPEQIARGEKLYNAQCARCHDDSTANGDYPNLWKMVPGMHQAFDNIVLKGARSYAGMASFADVLSPQDVHDIHAYLAEPPVKPITPLFQPK